MLLAYGVGANRFCAIPRNPNHAAGANVSLNVIDMMGDLILTPVPVHYVLLRRVPPYFL